MIQKIANKNAEMVFLERFSQDFLESSSANALLPSVRELSKRYLISPITVTRGLKTLAQQQKIITRPGVGTFTAAPVANSTSPDTTWQALTLGARAPLGEEAQMLLQTQRPDLLNLGSGYPDEGLQPHRLLQQAATHALRRPDAWSRSPAVGLEGLRMWFARELGAGVSPTDVLIAPGGQAAVATCLRALVPPSGAVLFESPTYFGALAVARSSGLACVPVPTDAQGIRPEWLEAALYKSGARVLYLQPNHHNPTGRILSIERRKALLEVAAKYNTFVVEDDYAHDFTLEGAKPRQLIHDDTNGRVVYIRSLTKSAAPSLRVAAIVARGAAFERLKAQLAISEMFTPQLLQQTALELVGSPQWHKHLKGLRQALKARRDCLVAALEATGFAVPHVPKGGFGVWLPVPQPDLEFAQNALQRGVQVSVGRAWFPAESAGDFVRLSFAALPEAGLLEAVRRLKLLIER
jgi:DNA-binding transcriptional MocR family regulator